MFTNESGFCKKGNHIYRLLLFKRYLGIFLL